MTDNNSRPLIQMVKVDKFFGSFQALRNIDLEVHKGERIVICGPSGSGKSTLIRCINRLEKHNGGQIIIDGIDYSVNKRGLNIVIIDANGVQAGNIDTHLTENILSNES